MPSCTFVSFVVMRLGLHYFECCFVCPFNPKIFSDL
jgi:hypothetical protein